MTRQITVPDHRGRFIYVEAPEELPTGADLLQPSIFLAGGITNCPDWQQDAIRRIELAAMTERGRKGITVLNPRRADFDVTDPNASALQIAWEFNALSSRASVVLFWFTEGPSVQPITLYELGRYAATKKVVVGAHPDYLRRFDVIEQMRHARPLLTVRDNLNDTVDDALKAIYR